MMRLLLLAPLLFLAAFAPPVVAGSSVVDFPLVQKGCVEAGPVTLGPSGRWARCRLMAREWIATIGLLDFYQVRYCLGVEGAECQQQALLIFSNRAYNPAARLVYQRIDPGATEYGAPMVVQSGQDSVLVISAGAPGAAPTRQHYLWQGNRWVPVETQAWLRELGQRLPRGTSVRAGVAPEAETMSARVPLYRRDDADCCPSGGVANVELGVAKGRFTVKRVTVASGDD